MSLIDRAAQDAHRAIALANAMASRPPLPPGKMPLA